VISIHCLPEILGQINDNMVIESPDIAEGTAVSLSVTGAEGNILSGNLSGIIQSAVYRITGDLLVEANDTLQISPGAVFSFDGEYSFTINGVLKAEGTEQDSIIFDKFNLDSGVGWKGLVLNNQTEATVFEYVRISGADVEGYSHGMKLLNSNPILSHVTISRCKGFEDGGGMYLEGSNPILTEITIANNTARYGGGMYLSYSNPTLTEITIANNTARYGGGMYLYFSNPILTNSIIWGNSPSTNSNYGVVYFSNIEGGWDGEGNIDADPLFTNSDNGDYSLSWANYPIEDETKSPCIDAGTADLDGDGNEDITDYFGQAPDMGAFEWYPEEPDYQPGDVTQDGAVNVQDIILLIAFILMNGTPDSDEFALADLNADGRLDVLDVVMLVEMILGG